MTFEHIVVDTEAEIARITLNRPAERNAMTPAMGGEIQQAVSLINKVETVRVVVITGAGRSFCAGANLRRLGSETGADRQVEGIGDGEHFYRMFLSIRDLKVPSIAAINGHAIGAGLCFALGADLRVMHRDAKVGMTFSKLGIHPGMAATWNLPRLIGPAQAAELLYTGRIIDGAEALRLGLVNRIGGDDFAAVVEELAEDIAGSGPIAVRMLKESLAINADATIDEALAREARVQARTFVTEDAAEGIVAVMAKRKPVFKNR